MTTAITGPRTAPQGYEEENSPPAKRVKPTVAEERPQTPIRLSPLPSTAFQEARVFSAFQAFQRPPKNVL